MKIPSFSGSVLSAAFNQADKMVYGQCTGFAGQVLSNVPFLGPYGYVAVPPTNYKEVTFLNTASGVIGVSFREPLPTNLPNPLPGDILIYNSGSGYIFLDTDGDTVLKPVDGKKVKVGNGTTYPVARADKADDEHSKIKTMIENHTHGYIAPGSGGGPAITDKPTTTYSKESVACDKLETE